VLQREGFEKRVGERESVHVLVMRLLLGSCSRIKKTAVSQAFANLLQPENLVCYASSSGVPEQPIGREQTREGAFNRAIDARRNHGADFDYVIGIENGIWEVNGGWVDGACICIIPSVWEGEDFVSSSHDSWNAIDIKIPIFLWSDLLVVPPVSERPFAEGPNGEWSEVKDPHAILTGGKRPRADFLKSALIPFVERLQAISTSSSTTTV
jgi:hypothetical protein